MFFSQYQTENEPEINSGSLFSLVKLLKLSAGPQNLKQQFEDHHISLYRWPSLSAGFLSRFAIRGFDYSWFYFYTQNLLSAGFTLIICGFSFILPQKQDFLEKTVLPCYPRFWYPREFPGTCNPTNNDGRLYFIF